VSADNPGEAFDPGRILATLDAHDVEYLMVGGLGAPAHGARRPTGDIDVVPQNSDDNYERLTDRPGCADRELIATRTDVDSPLTRARRLRGTRANSEVRRDSDVTGRTRR